MKRYLMRLASMENLTLSSYVENRMEKSMNHEIDKENIIKIIIKIKKRTNGVFIPSDLIQDINAYCDHILFQLQKL
jgi:hypothetical protein